MDPETVKTAMEVAVASRLLGSASEGSIRGIWRYGKKWVHRALGKANPQTVQQAEQNAKEYLADLERRVSKLEASGRLQSERLTANLLDPDVSLLLRETLIASARTKRRSKHKVVAALVAERLATESDTLVALASRQAAATVTNLTSIQLRVLGVATALMYLRPTPQESFDQTSLGDWLQQTLQPFRGLVVRRVDLLHLQGMACLSMDTITGADLYPTLTGEYPGGLTSEFEGLRTLLGTELAMEVMAWWQPKLLTSVRLTTVGVAIGAAAVDVVAGCATDLTRLLASDDR